MTSDAKILGIAIIVTVVLFPFYLIFIKKIRTKLNDNNYAARAMREGFSTIATLKKIRFHRGEHRVHQDWARTDFWTVTYEYIIQGKRYTKKMFVIGNRPEHEIKLFYLSTSPEKSCTETQTEERAVKQIGGLSVIVIPTIWAILLFYFFKFIIF